MNMTERICNQPNQNSNNHSNMKKTSIVILITLLTMIGEITFGILTGSMALLADGIHMGTHTFALMLTLIAYLIAGKHVDNPNFSFSSGKVGILGGYTNAILLGITALYMIYEAVHRLIDPETILFNQALLVAIFGLIVNIISAAILSSGGHDHGHDHEHHHDHNLRSAYIHVITDAMTSVLAIVALLMGKIFNHTWPDAVVAILGAVVILKWAYGLLFSSGQILVDYYPAAEDIRVLQSLAAESDSVIQDLHIWRTSENHRAMILNVRPGKSFDKEIFVTKIQGSCQFDHLTVEIEL